MSFYGLKTLSGLCGVHKVKVDANTSQRFGGSHSELAYKLSDGSAVEIVTHHSGVKVVDAVDSDVVLIILMGLDKDTVPTINASLVAVDGSYNLASNTHGLVIEGLLNSLDGETDIHHIAAAEGGVAVSGTGKLIALTIA